MGDGLKRAARFARQTQEKQMSHDKPDKPPFDQPVDGHNVTDSEMARVFLVLGGTLPAQFYKPQPDPVQINRVFAATTPQPPVDQYPASQKVLDSITAYQAWEKSGKHHRP